MGKTAEYFDDWLQSNDIPYSKWVSRNVAGEDTFDASSNLSCYKYEVIRQIINFRNEEVVSDTQLFVNGDNSLASGISSNDKFVINDKNRFPQMISKYYDEDGIMDYLIVYL